MEGQTGIQESVEADGGRLGARCMTDSSFEDEKRKRMKRDLVISCAV